MNAISAANNSSSPPTNQIPSKPKLLKRDTDTVLSSLLASLEPPPSPPESLLSVDPREFDSQWESGYSDSDAPPDLVPNKSHQDFKSGSSSSAHDTNVINDTNETSNDPQTGNQANMEQLDSISENDIVVNSNVDDSSDGDDDDYVNMDDEDVFDMLRDNSQLVINMLNNNEPPSTDAIDSNNLGRNDGLIPENSLEAMDTLSSDVPPPIPTTPLPSDDDEPPVKPPPRRESLPKYSENNNTYNYTGSSAPALNGSIGGHSR